MSFSQKLVPSLLSTIFILSLYGCGGSEEGMGSTFYLTAGIKQNTTNVAFASTKLNYDDFNSLEFTLKATGYPGTSGIPQTPAQLLGTSATLIPQFDNCGQLSPLPNIGNPAVSDLKYSLTGFDEDGKLDFPVPVISGAALTAFQSYSGVLSRTCPKDGFPDGIPVYVNYSGVYTDPNATPRIFKYNSLVTFSVKDVATNEVVTTTASGTVYVGY